MKPSNVDLGRVEGRFIVGIQDGADVDDEPDFIAAMGTIEFTASVPYLPDPTASPVPVTLLKTTIRGVLDSEGYLCSMNADGTPRTRGLSLVATDDPDLLVQNWTWNVTYRFTAVNGSTPTIQAHGISVPMGVTRDLTTALKVPSSPGYGLPQSEAAVLRAEAAATTAEAAALDVVTRADAGEFDGTDGTSGDVLTMGTVTTVAAGGAATATLSGASPNKVLNLGLPTGLAGNATVRFSTTAGKAIYLTEPGTAVEHLIAGDTGWRNIAADISTASGVAVTLARISRVGYTVNIELLMPSATPIGNISLGSLPAGFRGSTGAAGSRLPGTRGPVNVIVPINSAGSWSIANNSGSGEINIFGTFRTTDPWPTTLPGTAIGTIPNL